MKHAACLLLLLASLVGGDLLLAQDGPRVESAGDLLSAADRAFDLDEDETGRKILLDLLDRYPESIEVPTALRKLAEHHDGTAEGRARAIGWLRRLVRNHPDSNPAYHAPRVAAEIAGWEFNDFPRRVKAGTLRVPVYFSGGPHRRTFRLSRVPAEALRRYWEDKEGATSYPTQRELIKQITVRYDRGPHPEFDLSEPGVYEIEEEVEGFTRRKLVESATFGFGIRTRGGRGFVRVLDPWSGEPIEGAEIHVRQTGGEVKGSTDEGGLFFFQATSEGVATASVNGESWSCKVYSDQPNEEALVFLTTDRPIYRPGHTVQFKAVRRDRAGSVLSIPKEETVRLSVRGPEGRPLWTRDLPWNEAGAVSGTFTLGDEPALGDYTVVAHVETERHQADLYYEWFEEVEEQNHWRKIFRVAAYRKPEARVIVEPAGRTPDGKFRARIRAEYWFGGPVADAEVYWTAEARWKEESGWDEGFLSDARAWYFAPRPTPWDDCEGWWYDFEEFADGDGRTDAEGILIAEFAAPDDIDFEDIEVRAFVEDATGLVSEGSGAVGERAQEAKLTMITPRIAVAPGEVITAEALLVGPNGDPLPDHEVVFTALVPSGDYEWESVSRVNARTDASGRSRFEFPAPRVPRLRLRITSIDAAPVRRDLYVSYGIPKEGEIEGMISLLPDRHVAEPGETLRTLVRSREESLSALLVIEGDKFHEVRPIRIEPGCRFIEIEVLPEHVPNLFVRLLATRDGRTVGGSFEMFVYPPDRVFAIDVTTSRDSYAPGETAEVVVTATAPDGSPVSSEVEIAIVDESILALRPDRTQDIRTFFRLMRGKGGYGEGLWSNAYFHGSFRWGDFIAPNLILSGAGAEGAPLFGKSEEGDQLIGGGAEDDSEGGAPGVRRLFPDTLLYRAHARTGEDGRCSIEVETPGSLTTWRIVARAVAGADRFGQGASSVVTTKDVVLRLAAPRFLTVGDEGVVVGVLRSDLPEREEFTVSLDAEGVETVGGARTVALDPGTETRLEFTVRATAAGTAKLSASAVSPIGSDAMEIEIPVKAHGTPMHIAQTGRVDGSLTLSLPLPPDAETTSASLEILVTSPAQAIRETLPFLAGYPYGCVEQTMSRFLPSVVAAGAMKRLGMSDPALEAQLPDMVDKGLQRLYRFQHEDGGFGWWENDETHPFMTAYVVYGLVTARNAGFAVDETSLSKAVNALEDLNAGPFGLYARVVAGEEAPAIKQAKSDDPEDRAWLILAGRHDLVDEVLEPPADGTGPEWIRIAALNVRALHAANPADPRIGPLVRWLLERRTGRGWHSTLDSAYVVYALAAVAQPELATDVRIRVNGSPVPITGARALVPPELLRPGQNDVEILASGGEVYATARLRWLGHTEGRIPAKAGAFIVTRQFERAVPDGQGKRGWVTLENGDTVQAGDEIRVVLTIDAGKGDHEYVMIECPTPAGFEPQPEDPYDEYWWDSWYQRREVRDDRVSIAAREIYRKERFDFRFRATFPGTWHALPATAFEMYRPDRIGRSDEMLLTVE